MLRTTRILTASLALAALVGLSACGDSSKDEATTATTTEGDGGTSDGGTAVDCAASPGETVTVEIGEFVFDPTPVEISACDEVVWKNTHDQAHTSSGNGDQAWSTGNIQPGDESDAVLFDTAGSFTYACALHPFMMGSVEVS